MADNISMEWEFIAVNFEKPDNEGDVILNPLLWLFTSVLFKGETAPQTDNFKIKTFFFFLKNKWSGLAPRIFDGSSGPFNLQKSKIMG